MNDKEAVEMMQRCKAEILSLRAEIGYLRPKAEAYESIAQILSFLPHQGQVTSEDVAWVLDKRIREIEQEALKPQHNI